MTKIARSVLEDARLAVDELQGEHDDGRVFRVRWRSAVANLRAVLHTLKHADQDRGSDPGLARAIDEVWNERRRDSIYAEIIEQERNLVLKRGEASASRHQYVRVGTAFANSRRRTRVEPDPVTTRYDFKGGSFDGEDSRALARQALAWVEAFLDSVEARANEDGPRKSTRRSVE